jgi:hypothetical protein
MSATRGFVFGVLAGLFDFGRITGTKRGTTNKTIALDFEGNVDQEDRAETESADVWGCSAMQYRPADPDGDGAAEVLYIRRDGELLPIATRDFRFQVDLEKGEVVVTNNDKANPCRIWLKANGHVYVEGVEVRLGSTSASDAVALAPAVNSRLDDIAEALDALAGGIPVPNDGGAAIQTAFKTKWPGSFPIGIPTSAADVGAPKVKAV